MPGTPIAYYYCETFCFKTYHFEKADCVSYWDWHGSCICKFYASLILRKADSQFETYHFETYQYEKVGKMSLKGRLFDHLVLFLLVILALILPFGLVLVPLLAKKLGFISNISSLATICSSFSSIFSKNSSNITYLSENVDHLDSVKSIKNRPLGQLLPLLTLLIPVKTIATILASTSCILLINLALNMHYLSTVKNNTMFLT